METKVLVGYTGFVGSNIAVQTHFDYLYNTKNIQNSYGTKPDVLVYSGVRAEKFLANNDPQKDYGYIEEAISIIKKIAPKMLVLISTIDVYKNPVGVDEDTLIDTEGLHPYGFNRYCLEKWVEQNIDSHLIVRLPGLYGMNLKKNFIYDMVHVIPSMLNHNKFNELHSKDSSIERYYQEQENGFYKCKELTINEKNHLKNILKQIAFSALNFTDSRASFQFYNLSFLWGHIQKALISKIRKLNIATPPVTAGELYYYLNQREFVNEVSVKPVKYDTKTKYADLFAGRDGYIIDKESVFSDIKQFVEALRNETVHF